MGKGTSVHVQFQDNEWIQGYETSESSENWTFVLFNKEYLIEDLHFFVQSNTALIVSLFGIFLVRIFPHSEWIQRDTGYLSVFGPNAEKYGPKNRDTFHEVKPLPGV